MTVEKNQIKTKRFAIETIGCRLNQYESEKMAGHLTGSGLDRVDFNQEADLYLINTCTVTGRADASCRHVISRASRRNNEAVVVVIGCYVESEPEKTAQLNGVDLVINNRDKGNIEKILNKKFPFLFKKEITAATPTAMPEFVKHSRAWIKISDGCNQRCAYCIIPSVRGKLTNRPAPEIIEEIDLLSKSGFHEVVLTGVHIGQYDHDKIKSLAELTRYILKHTDITRLRLSSVEPQEVTADLVATMKNGGQKICRHLHVPLQSGSDHVLKMMHRPYSAKNYLNNLRMARENIDGLIIGADIIVGFPGETENDFGESVKVAQSGLIDYLHVFSYSDRPGTESSKMPDKISSVVIKERSKILRDISDDNYRLALKKEIGQTVYVISEFETGHTMTANRPGITDQIGITGKQYQGITDNYLKIIIPAQFGGGREILKLKVTAVEDTHLIGTL